MDFQNLRVKANCILDEGGIYEHIRLALERNLPLHDEARQHDRIAVLVGSGPSVKGQLESIREEMRLGHTIIAIKDAHDWLIENGVVPHYAVAVDPQEHRWNCFTKKHESVHYYIASQCHPAMFEHLKDRHVILWHLYIKEGQDYPPNSLLVTGGTTTGLRAITLFYSMGFRKFSLYGYDSCLTDGQLRVTGKMGEKSIEIFVGQAKRKFITTPEMAAQANEFQVLLKQLADISISSHGHGVLTAILEERAKAQGNLEASFLHPGDETSASFRYRCKIPSFEMGLAMHNLDAKVLVFSKPLPSDVNLAKELIANGKKIIVDFCDDHFEEPHYQDMLLLADRVTCPTKAMAERIMEFGYSATVIPDPYEYPLVKPHCYGANLLWFGHGLNYQSLERVLPELEDYNLRVVSNREGSIQWTPDILYQEFPRADIVIIPATASYKSANRAVEAIRQGCFVVAEYHPSLEGFPGIWIGNIKEGIEWAMRNQQSANERTRTAQTFVEIFSPEQTANAWRSIFKELDSTSDAARSSGPVGSTSTWKEIPTSRPMCDYFLSTSFMRMS